MKEAFRLLLFSFFALLGVTVGSGEVINSRSFDAMYVVSNEVRCIMRQDKFLELLPYPTIEGGHNLIDRQIQQQFELWKFSATTKSSRQTVTKSVFASFETERTPFPARIVFGTSLLVLEQQDARPPFKRHTIIWNGESKSDLPLKFDHAIAFDRAYENAVIPWQDGVAVVKVAALTNSNPDLALHTNWNIVRQFPQDAYHSHVILSRDGSHLFFFPGYRHHVLVLGVHDRQQINLPPGLNDNDLIDADVVDGQILFVTRNFGSENDSYQITDATWKILANLPGEAGWFRPIWDIDGKQLLFQDMSSFVLKVDEPIQFRAWNYQSNILVKMTVE